MSQIGSFDEAITIIQNLWALYRDQKGEDELQQARIDGAKWALSEAQKEILDRWELYLNPEKQGGTQNGN